MGCIAFIVAVILASQIHDDILIKKSESVIKKIIQLPIKKKFL